MSKTIYNRYILNEENSEKAIEKGLAEADWYTSPVSKDALRKLLQRRNGPALRDTIIWFGLLGASGYAGYLLWGTWWAIIPFFVYGIIYGTTSDSRWHESSHGTAFASDWLNNALYEISSFMVMRESTVWRWSHTRHHSDTIIAGRDPEIVVPRPPDIRALILSFFGWGAARGYFTKILLHSTGRLSGEEAMFIPESERGKVFFKARIYMMIYLSVIALAVYFRTFLPFMYVGLPNFYGAWLMPIYGYTQHAGLAENVLDHRLNCRTVYMNPINRFLYWNMNYHVEHHMFPLVPYHNLPKLHELVKPDMPTPYSSLWNAWREIIPTVLRQVKDPAWHVKRKLPEAKVQHAASSNGHASSASPDSGGWVEVCDASNLEKEDVIRFDHLRKTYALIRDAEGALHATDGICTHGNTHLSGGLVKGKIIECPKHNGRFNFADGSPARMPVCRGLATYPLEERKGRLFLNVAKAGGAGAHERKAVRFRVVSNRNVATFIKELVVEPLDTSEKIQFTPGDYMQFDIPAYENIRFREFDIPEPYATAWETQHIFDLTVSNSEQGKRNNYSLASNQELELTLRFNVRIATPPPGQDCPPGVGSSYVFNLKPGDTVSAIGPFGDFHIKPTQKEMVYIGGGAGMAPMRAHLSHLFETSMTSRKVSFWYGARSSQELFYQDYFIGIAAGHPNFSFYPALSSPLPDDAWTGHTGFIHEVVRDCYLAGHENPAAIEFYLCGPPMMIKACTEMLEALNVPADQIAFDEF